MKKVLLISLILLFPFYLYGQRLMPDKNSRIFQEGAKPSSVKVGDYVFTKRGNIKTKLSSNLWALIVGDSRVIRKGDSLRFTTHKPKTISKGIYEEEIDEILTVRASRESNSIYIGSGKDYLKFFYEKGHLKTKGFTRTKENNGWIWDYGKYEIENIVDRWRVKEKITLHKGAPNEFRWLVSSNTERHNNGFGKFKIERAFATDALNDTIPIVEDFIWEDNSWWYIINIDVSKASYPIVIDPIVEDTTAYTSWGYIYTTNANYLNGRNAITGDFLGENDGAVGRAFISENYYTFRTFLKFSYDLGIDADSAKLVIVGQADYSKSDFYIYILGAKFDVIELDTYNNIVGWKTAGDWDYSYYGNFNIINFSTGDNVLKFNDMGIDSLNYYDGSNFDIVLCHNSDVIEQAPPFQKSYVYFTNRPPPPILIIYYTEAPPPEEKGVIYKVSDEGIIPKVSSDGVIFKVQD